MECSATSAACSALRPSTTGFDVMMSSTLSSAKKAISFPRGVGFFKEPFNLAGMLQSVLVFMETGIWCKQVFVEVYHPLVPVCPGVFLLEVVGCHGAFLIVFVTRV